MGNLTITIDNETLKTARIKALEQGTSVNALLRDYLEAYSGVRLKREQAASEILSLSESSASRRGNSKWTREALHERK